ncbi:MAG: LCP family protein [bacterium]|nr:LCP family protein [bacterium]
MFKRIAVALGALILLSAIGFTFQNFLGRDNLIEVIKDEEVKGTEDLTVLVMGQVAPGQGGRWHFSPNLTDAIVLVYYRAETKTVNLISLPRDLYGKFGDSYLRLNRVFMSGKVEDLMAAMPEMTGIEVDKFAVVDLAVVSAAIDSLGGVDVDLPSRVVDPVTGFTLQAGVQKLNGEDAVWLIRNRFAPQGDFFREKNQHLVVEAALQKYEGLSPLRKTVFAFRMLPEIKKSQANFDLNDLFFEFGGIDQLNFNSIVLDFDTGLLLSSSIQTNTGESAYVLIPKEGINEYSAMRAFIEERVR